MILFGHLGLTLAIVRTTDKTISNRNFIDTGRKIDYRLVLIGSLLPDLIDKSILFVLSNETVRSGRIIAHSLFFVLTLIVLGLTFQHFFKNSSLLLVAVCSFIHLILDTMWTQLNLFLWPVYDLIYHVSHKTIPVWSPSLPEIPRGEQIEFNLDSFKNVFFNLNVAIPEIVGALILTFFFVMLIKRNRLSSFLRRGTWI